MHIHNLRQYAWLLLMLTGCALIQSEEVTYLKDAKMRHATQAEVKQRLGAPKMVAPLSTGETAWRYQIWTNTGGDLNGPGRSYCDQYDLRFDSDNILRDWTHGAC